MNLSQLRKLVQETAHLPDNTVLIQTTEDGLLDEVRSLQPKQVLVFQRPRSLCPLGTIFHRPAGPEVFGFNTQDELDAQARLETVLELV